MSTEAATRDFTLEKYDRFWAVFDPDGNLVTLTVYKKGGLEVIRRLRDPASQIHDNPLA